MNMDRTKDMVGWGNARLRPVHDFRASHNDPFPFQHGHQSLDLIVSGGDRLLTANAW